MAKVIFVMKTRNVLKILALMKTRTQIEEMRLAEVRRRQFSELSQAESLQQRAMKAALDHDGEPTPVQLIHNQHYCSNLRNSANRKRMNAKSLQPVIDSRRVKLQNALQRELAWATVSERAEALERKLRNDREEGQREQVRLMGKAIKTVR